MDSAIHFLFSHHNKWFEGLCNPPGGDWAGISLIDKDKNIFRWLSLPRVSGTSKRPDHIYQFSIGREQFILIIESKDYYSNLETNIGPRLKQYIQELSSYTSNVFMPASSKEWNQNDLQFPQREFSLVTCVAYLDKDYGKIIKHNSDIEISVKYDGPNPVFKIIGTTSLGKKIAQQIKCYSQ